MGCVPSTPLPPSTPEESSRKIRFPDSVKPPFSDSSRPPTGNAEIEEEIRRDRLAGKKEVKILLLGPGEFHLDSMKT